MINKCREFSIPLILGVIVAIIWANLSPTGYHEFLHASIPGTHLNFHFLINDIFMVFFFAIAGIEIVNNLHPGGSLYPIKKAVTPLLATLGGVIGPIALFFILNNFIGSPEFIKGWGVCTATDIALAWLLGRIVFGAGHPAISFLLLFAVADDGIGLIIIAIFYPIPDSPFRPIWLLLVAAGMLIAYTLNKKGVKQWYIYFLTGGIICWIGMFNSNLHPALSLIFIVPFLPHMVNKEILDEEVEVDPKTSALHSCHHSLAPFVDFGLFFFGLANAGVEFSAMSNLTLIIFISLIVGKTVGISLFTFLAVKIGFSLPDGMIPKEVFLAGFIGGLGLTVALFVSSAAFTDLTLQGASKMGALFTALAFILVPPIGKLLKIEKVHLH